MAHYKEEEELWIFILFPYENHSTEQVESYHTANNYSRALLNYS